MGGGALCISCKEKDRLGFFFFKQSGNMDTGKHISGKCNIYARGWVGFLCTDYEPLANYAYQVKSFFMARNMSSLSNNAKNRALYTVSF